LLKPRGSPTSLSMIDAAFKAFAQMFTPALRGVLINFHQFPPTAGLAVIAGMCVLFFVAALWDFNRS